MRFLVLLGIFLFGFSFYLTAQSKAELEDKRKKTLKEITFVDNLLKTTAKEKDESINAVKIIANKLTLRESVIKGMREEISLFSDRIALNTLAIDMMERTWSF